MAESSHYSNGIGRGVFVENNKHRCFLCTNEEICEDWQAHIEKPQHVSATRQFRLIFVANEEDSIDCKACNAKIDWEGLRNHAKWHKLVPWYEIENKDKIFFENRLLNVNSSFICVPCEKRFDEWSGAFVHISEEQHRNSIALEPPIHETFAPTDTSYEFLIAEGFEPWGSNTVKCRPCLCPNVRLNNLEEHISKPEHNAAKLRFIADSKYRRDSNSARNVGQQVATESNRNRGATRSSNNANETSASEKLVAELRASSLSNSDKRPNAAARHRTSSVSRVPNSNTRNRGSNRPRNHSYSRQTNSAKHRESEAHSRDSNNRRGSFPARNGNSHAGNGKSNSHDGNSASRPQRHDWPVETRQNGLYCTICEEAVQTTSAIHIAEEKHVKNLKRLGHEFLTPIGDYKFRCNCCNVNIPNLENVFRHIKGMRHQNLLAARSKQVKAAESTGEAKVETKGEPLAESKEEKTKGKTTSFKMNFPRPSNPSAMNFAAPLPPNQYHQPSPNYGPGSNILPQGLLNNSLGLNSMPQFQYPLSTSYPPQPLMQFPVQLPMNLPMQPPMNRPMQPPMNPPRQPAPYLPLAVNSMPRPKMDYDIQGTKVHGKFTPESLPRDYITVQNSQELLCRICDFIIRGHANVDDHINDKNHSRLVDDFCATILQLGENDYWCKRCNATVNNRNDLYIHLKQNLHKGNQGFVNDSLNSNELNIQDKSLMAENNSSRSRLVDDCIVILGRLDFCCKICHVVLSGDQTTIEAHLQGPEHYNASQKDRKSKIIPHDKYDCISCKCAIPNFGNVPPHVFGEQHKSKSPGSSTIRKLDSRELGPYFVIRIGEEDYYCNICNITIITRGRLDQHIRDEMHTKSRKNYGCDQIVTAKGENLYCQCCDCTIPEFDCAFVHLSGRRHLENVAEKRREQLQQEGNNEVSVRNDEERKQMEKSSGAGIEIQPEVVLDNARESVSNTPPKEEKNQEAELGKVQKKDFEKHFQRMLDEVTKEKLPDVLKIESEVKRLPIEQESLISRSLASSTMSLNTSGKKLRAPRIKKFDNAIVVPDDIFEMLEKLRELKNDIDFCAATHGIEDSSLEFFCMICMEKIGGKSDLYEHFRSSEHCEALESKKMAHKEYEVVADQYSDYDLAKEFLEEESEEIIHCWICDNKISNVDECIKAHIIGENHAENRDKLREKNRQIFSEEVEPKIACDWYSIQEFYCALCRSTYDTELTFIEHARTPEHVLAVKEIDSSCRPLIHDFCSTCSILWFGDRSYFAHHAKTFQHKLRLGDKNTSETQKLRDNIADCLFDISRNGVEEMSIDSYQFRRDFVSDLEITVQQSFPGTKVQVISSNPTSIDSGKFEVLLNFGVKLDEKSEDSVRFLAQRVAAALSDHPARWHMALINDKSLPMRVTTHHIPSKSRVEIFLNDDFPFPPSKLFNSLRAASVCIDWPIRAVKLCITLYENEFQEFMRPYIEDTMIFFMQSKSLLPKVSDLVRSEGSGIAFKPDWDIQINEMDVLKEYSEKSWELMIEYHRFYATFDYRREVVCPWMGRALKKQDFGDRRNLPKEMNLTSKSHVPQDGEFLTPFCIQNPFGLMENRTKEMTKAQLNGFREYCLWVVETLERKGAPNSNKTS